MGLEESDAIEDASSGGKSSTNSKIVACSICLELVAFNKDRSCVKLICGHEFHLDCIGSAFNSKGAMLCPNCRNVEKGQWLYAMGCPGCEDPHDEDFYDLSSYSEMSFGVRWCPFTFSQLPSSFEEGEFPSTTYHDIVGHHAIFAEQPSFSSTSHPCPYFAYYGPVSSSSNSSGSASDSTSFSNYWGGLSGPSEISSSYAFPTMDPHYHSWEHHSPLSAAGSRLGSADQPLSVSQRPARISNDVPRPGSFPGPSYLVGHSSGPRAGSSTVTSSMISPYPGSAARARDRVQALEAYFQPPSSSALARTPMVSGSRRSSAPRGTAQPALSSDQNSGFYVFPPSTSNRNFVEGDNPMPRGFHSTWERDQMASLPPLSQVDRESNWSPLHLVAASGSGSFRQRHSSERNPSQGRS